MRVTLVLLATINLVILVLVLPPRAFGAGGAEFAHWMSAEKQLVDSGQLVLNPSDPIDSDSKGWLVRHLAPNLLDGNRRVYGELAVFLCSQTAVLAVLACVASPSKRRSIPSAPIAERSYRHISAGLPLRAMADAIGRTANMASETHVSLVVLDFGDDPSLVSDLMGIEPTRAWVKGQTHTAALPGARRTHSRWALDSGLEKSAPLEAQLGALLSRLEPRRAEIGRVARRFSAQIGIAQYFNEVNPKFRIEAELLQRVANLGVALDFDQYCLGTDEGG